LVGRSPGERKSNTSDDESIADTTSKDEVQEYQSKLSDAMVINSQLEEAKVRLEYQIEDLKDRIAEFEDQLCDQKEAFHNKSKDMMEAEYEVRVLKDKLALLMNGDASPNNNLIMSNGRSPTNLAPDHTDSQPEELPCSEDSVMLEQLSRLSNEMQRALNQCEAVESEMSALLDENLVIRRERNAAVDMARSLRSQMRAAELERSRAVDKMKDQSKQLEELTNEKEKLQEEVARLQRLCANNTVYTIASEDLSDKKDNQHQFVDQVMSLDEPVRGHQEHSVTMNYSSTKNNDRGLSVSSRTSVQLEKVEELDESGDTDRENPVIDTEISPSLESEAEHSKQVNGDVVPVQSLPGFHETLTSNDSMGTTDLPTMGSSLSTFTTSTTDSIAQWDVISNQHPPTASTNTGTLRPMGMTPVWKRSLPVNTSLASLQEMKNSMSTVQYWLASAFLMFGSFSGIPLLAEVLSEVEEDYPDGGRKPKRCSISEASVNLSWHKERSAGENIVLARMVKDTITEHAGKLSCDDSVITVSWPDGAVDHLVSHDIHYMAVEGIDAISLNEGEVLLSPVLYVSSPQTEYGKPLTVEIPHCALIDSGGWNVTLLRNNSLVSQEPNWRSVAMWRWPHVGSSDNNDCHLSSELFRVEMSCTAGFALIGRQAVSNRREEAVPLKRVSLAAFFSVRSYPRDPRIKIVHLEVTCTSDVNESQKAAEFIKSEDYHYPCSPWSPLVVSGNKSNLIIKLVGDSTVHYSFIGDSSKVIPFRAFWYGTGISSVDFTLAVEDPSIEEISVNLFVGQIGERGDHDEQQLQATVNLQADDALPYRSHVTSPWRVLLPFSVANKLCRLLDHEDPRGNDWRHVAHVLGLNPLERRQMERLPSPTHYILSRLPSLDDNRNTLQGLFDALFRTERSDAVEAITDWLSDM
jgi:hypothetical protein